MKAIINLFRNAFTDEHATVEVHCGVTVEEAAGTGLDGALVFVNGDMEDKDYVLKDGDVATVRVFPRGWLSGIKSSLSKAWDSFSDFGASLWNGGLIGGANWLGSYFWNNMVTPVVQELVKGIIPEAETPVTGLETSGSSVDDSALKENPTISGASNQSAQNKAIPVILGETLITPVYIGKPYTEIPGGMSTKQVYKALFLIGYKDIDVSDFRFKYSAVASNSANVRNGYVTVDGPEYKKAEMKLEVVNDGESELYPQKVIQEDINVQLVHPQGTSVESGTLLPTERFSAVNPMGFELEFGCHGLYHVNKNSGEKEASSFAFRVEYSFDEKTWKSDGLVGYGMSGSGGRFSYSANRNEEFRFLVKKTFSYGELKDMVEDDDALNYIYIRCWRDDADSLDSYTCNKLYLMGMRTFCFDREASRSSGALVAQPPMDARYRDKVVRVALQITASESIKGNLGSFNCIVKSRHPVYRNGEWGGSERTSNPASIIYSLFRHECLGTRKYDLGKVNLDRLGELYDYCERCGFTYNAAMTSQVKFSDTLYSICRVAHSFPAVSNGRYSFIIDRKQEFPVMVLNGHNMLDSGYSNSKSFDELPDGLEITFVNKDIDYQKDTIKCLYDSSRSTAPDLNLEKVTVEGITDRTGIWRYGKYVLLKRMYRPEVWSRSVSVDGNLIEVGDRVDIQDDTLLVGVGEGGCVTGLIEDGHTVTGFTVDGLIPLADPSETYAVRFFRYGADGKPESRVLELENEGSGAFSAFRFRVPVDIDGCFFGEGDICSFGVMGRVTAECLCVGKKPNDDGTFDLTLAPYNDNVYTFDTKDRTQWTEDLPPFDSKVTKPVEITRQPGIDKDYATRDELISSIGSLASGGEVIGPPDAPAVTLARAQRDGVRIEWQNGGSGLRNNARCYVVELDRGGGFERVGITSSASFLYSTEGEFLEMEDFDGWMVRVLTVSVYARTLDPEDEYVSGYSAEKAVDASSYGTWKISVPEIDYRVSDRTITLKISQPERSDRKEQYGTIRYKVQVARSSAHDGEDTDGDRNYVWRQPSRGKNPYPDKNATRTRIIDGNELNYKVWDGDGSGEYRPLAPWVESDGTYIQTMPLFGQGRDDIVDTIYGFRACAFNEKGEDTGFRTVFVTALCTSIRDIVYANSHIKEQYVESLSAISANLGSISSGSMTDGRYNYWALSDINGMKRGAFRVGDENEYLKVIPPDNDGDAFSIEFKVGNFQVSTSATKIEGVIIIQENDRALDRGYLAPNKFALQHRNSVGSPWYDITDMDTSGIITKSYRSNDKILIGNFTQLQQRQMGHDIGRPYLSGDARVWHFDNDFNCNDGTDGGLAISGGTPLLKGSGDSNGFNFTPAVLAVAPYCNDAKSLYGKVRLDKSVPGAEMLCVDMWFQYVYGERQTLVSVGTESDVLKIQLTGDEPVAVVSGACSWMDDRGNVVWTPSRTPKAGDTAFRTNPDESDARPAGTLSGVTHNGDWLVTEIMLEGEGSGYQFEDGSPEANWETFAPEEEWGGYSVLANRAGEGKSVAVHEGQTDSEEKDLKNLGISLNDKEWTHLGVFFSKTGITFMIQPLGAGRCGNFVFRRYGSGKDDFTVTVNESRNSILVDELYIDSAENSINGFEEQTYTRKPWGALDDTSDWFIFDAKDTSKVKSNILEAFKASLLSSTEFRDAVKALIEK